jgi:hypothetical protein
MEKFERLQWSEGGERERELSSGRTWERMVDLSLATMGGRREGINTPLVPMVGQVRPRHYRSLNAALSH